MKQRQVDHVPTKEEIAYEERLGWRNYRKHDFVATDKMRLEAGAGEYGSLVLEDTVATRIEDKLTRVLERVEQRSDAALAREEAQRQREIREVEERRRAEIERERARAYGRWHEPLEGLVASMGRHEQVSALAVRLRDALPGFVESE